MASSDNWSMGEPPKLSRDNFHIWKNRMIAFLNCVDSDLLSTIIREGPPPTDKDRKVALEHKAKHIIIMSIPDDIYHLVMHFETAKEIWDSLVVFFEGNDEVRKMKGNLLLRRYEVFAYKPGESITETYSRFTCLLNDLKQHGKVLDNVFVVEKFLKSLPREWGDSVSKATGVEDMSLQTVYGKLLCQELRKETKELKNT